MKKITLLSIALIAISVASCKKDRTCSCTETDNSVGATTTEYKVVYKKVTKGSAKAACMSLEVTPDGQTAPIITEKRTCTLS